MKKIFSLVLVVAMLLSMAITTNAAYSMGFSTTTPTVKVGDTFDVALNINLTDGGSFSGGKVTIKYDDTIATLKAINSGTMTVGAENWTDLGEAIANKNFTTALTESGTFCIATFEAIAPADAFVVSANTVSFTFRNPTKRVSDASEVGVATIKIEADEPTPEKVENRITNFDKVIKTEDTVWENLAVYTATFNLNDIVTSEGYGISVGANKLESKAAAVDGQGTVNMVLAYFGITEAQANDMVVNQFYSVIKDAE